MKMEESARQFGMEWSESASSVVAGGLWLVA